VSAETLCAPWLSADDIGPAAKDVPDKVKSMSAELRLDVVTFASEILFTATGGRYPGECERAVRPCARAPEGFWPAPWPLWWPGGVPVPLLGPGTSLWEWQRSWGDCGCGLSSGACSCGWLPQVTLGAFPITGITEVLIDGAVLNPDAYRVDERRWLVRVDGSGWPRCQHLERATTEEGTWQVEFTAGAAPPRAGAIAARLYAIEIAKSLSGCDDCQLPDRVASILRQGTTVTFRDPTQLLNAGLTGVPLVDTWVQAENGGRRAHVPATITSPDVLRSTRRQEPWPLT
jgi:hypothetical protein